MNRRSLCFRLGLILLVACLVISAACGQPTTRPVAPESGLRMWSDLDWLCAPERRGRGQDKQLTVARWLARRFADAGLRPLFGDSYLQAFSKLGLIGANVGGILPGSRWPKDRSHVIISAHHDHKGVRRGVVYPGAADNAAGVSVLLEVLRAMRGESGKLPHSVVFLAFDLEELGLLGSRHYVKHAALPLASCLTFTTMDILGREVLNLPGHHLAVLGGERSPQLFELAAEAPPAGLELLFMGVDAIGDRSDYAAFRDAGVPFLFFSTGENRDYHRSSDTPNHLHMKALELQAAHVLAVVRRLAALKERPTFLDQPRTSAREIASLKKVMHELQQSPAGPLRQLARKLAPSLPALLDQARRNPQQRLPLRTLVGRLMLTLRRTF